MRCALERKVPRAALILRIASKFTAHPYSTRPLILAIRLFQPHYHIAYLRLINV
jgi:hypothetical protein